MERITTEIYLQNKNRYILKSGHEKGAPKCPFGNIKEWVGFDTKENKYVRFSKSLFKKLVLQKK